MDKMLVGSNVAKAWTPELRELSTGTGKSKALDLQKFPQGTLQIFGGAGGDAPTGLTGNVEIADVADGAWVVFATFTQANLGTIVGPAPGGAGGFILLPVGVRYVRVDVTALAGGKVGVVGHFPAQS